jgi:hypothetical protein
MLVKTNALVEIAASPAVVFDFVTSLSNLPKVFRGYGLIPAIIKADTKSGFVTPVIFLVGVGRLCLYRSGFNRQVIKGISYPDLV